MGNDIETIQATIDILILIVAFGMVLAFAGLVGQVIQTVRIYRNSKKGRF